MGRRATADRGGSKGTSGSLGRAIKSHNTSVRKRSSWLTLIEEIEDDLNSVEITPDFEDYTQEP